MREVELQSNVSHLPSVVDGLCEGRQLVVGELAELIVEAAIDQRVARRLRVEVARTGSLKQRLKVIRGQRLQAKATGCSLNPNKMTFVHRLEIKPTIRCHRWQKP